MLSWVGVWGVVGWVEVVRTVGLSGEDKEADVGSPWNMMTRS